MDKSVEKAITFLDSILEKWKIKNAKEGKEYFIFFPKFLIKDKILFARIPIFEKINNESYKVISWKIYNLDNYSSINCEEEKNQIIIKNKLNYKEEKFEKNIKEFYAIFKRSKRIKNEQNLEDLKLLKEDAPKFNINLNESLGSIYKDIYEFLECKKNQIQIKYTAEEWYNKFLTLTNIEKKEYDFEFDFQDGLRFISDRMLNILFNMIKNSMEMNIVIRKANKADEKDKIIISNNIINLCNRTYNMDDLENAVNTGKIDNKDFYTKSKTEFNRLINWNINQVCNGCKFEKCPKYMALYIIYLMNNGLLLEKLKDRENFRSQEYKSDYFTFNWNVEDGLKRIPEDIYNYSEELVNRELIEVQNTLNENNMVKIYSALTCDDYKLINGDINKLPEIIKKRNEWTFLSRSLNYKIKICNDYVCRLESCPIVIAGYIYYLKRNGKETQIAEDRKYYYQNKDRIDFEVTEERKKYIEELEAGKNIYIDDLRNKYKDKVNNLDDLIDIILNSSQQQLHCVFEGNDSVIKKECYAKISETLNNIGKIDFKYPTYMSLQNLAASQAYIHTFKNNIERKDINGVLYQIQDAIKFTEIPQRQLYILNGVDEFVKDYKYYKSASNNNYIELRKKQYEHAIDILTNMTYKNYIIIDSTEKEINSLLELNPKLQFTFQNYRYKTAELTLDELFDLYTKEVRADLIEKLRKEPEKYKKQFNEYISLNRNFLPFSQRELISYLALYSNTKGDVVFPENIYKKETVEESLKNIIGLQSVKDKVKEFEKYMLFKVKAKSMGLSLQNSNMHMIFTGNPGTGKTTIARIMAKMLFDLGLIKENKLIEVERKDLVANYIGQTATKTSEIIEKAMGGVLFIDEAYTLAQGSSNDFGPEAVATLIKAMEDHKDELVVIFAGYKDEMKSFLEINAGIASRIGYTFDFQDYSEKELTEMFKLKVTNMGFKYEEDIEKELNSICSYFTKKKSFGNGRFVDKLIQETIMKHALSDSEDITLITTSDIPTIEELSNTTTNYDKNEVDKMLDGIVGMKELKEKIKEFEKYVIFIKEAENHKITIPNQNLHMIFTGNPGTGKTTVARIMAKMLSSLGIIHENKLVEVERKDLVAGYTGQTAPKTAEVIERAMGGVLFIDEAYTLAQGGSNSFGAEAIATLIKAMEDHKGEFVVIFAGYKKEMKEFLDINSGISSRIGYTFDFPDYTDEEFCEILYKKIEKSGLRLNKNAIESIQKIMKYFCNVENIGNGRFVDKVFQEILVKHAKDNLENIDEISKNDIPTIKEITKSLFNGNNMIDPSKITEEAQKRTAVHEIGHAVLRYLLFEESGIKKITINAEGTGTLGYVSYKESEGEYTRSKTKLLNQIIVSMGGMASEQYFLGEFENGNTSDLEKATYIAKLMITRFGMSDLGFGQINNADGVMSKYVQDEINKILKECFDKALEIIAENKENMKKTIDYLMEHKEIDEEMLIEMFDAKKSKKSTSRNNKKLEKKN